MSVQHSTDSSDVYIAAMIIHRCNDWLLLVRGSRTNNCSYGGTGASNRSYNSPCASDLARDLLSR